MQLIQAKVRSVDGVKDTGWFVPGRETTVLFGEHGSGKTALLKALQTLNPPYEIETVNPFVNHPRVWHQDGYSRQVIPWKKTAVFLVFSARPDQVVRLAEIDADLIETDRIEIGRRLDNSRWISFVELSAAGRWREIAEDMDILSRAVADRDNGSEITFFAGFRAADRLQGDIAAKCLRWLERVKPHLAVDQRARYQHCLHHIERRQRFFRAEEHVTQELPLTLYLDMEYRLSPVLPITGETSDRERSEISTVENLLFRLYRKYDMRLSEAVFRALLTEAEKQLASLWQIFTENGWPIPVLRFAGEKIHLMNIPDAAVHQHVYHVGLTCLLARICHGERPVLLIDCTDRCLRKDDRLELIRFLQQLGSWCQLLAATASEDVVDCPGWQSVLRIGPAGITGFGSQSP